MPDGWRTIIFPWLSFAFIISEEISARTSCNEKLVKFVNKLLNKIIGNGTRILLQYTKLAGSPKLNCINRIS